jgi:hypothetical protein
MRNPTVQILFVLLRVKAVKVAAALQQVVLMETLS